MRERFNAKQSYGTIFIQLSKPTLNRHTQSFGCFAAAVECRSGQLGAMKVEPALFSQLVYDTEISPAAFRLWHYLMGRQGRNEKSWPSMNTICKDLKYGKTALQRYIKELEARGYIQVTSGTQRNSNEYYVSGTVSEQRAFAKTPLVVPNRTHGGPESDTEYGTQSDNQLISSECIKGMNPSSFFQKMKEAAGENTEPPPF